MKSIEITANSYAEALKQALEELGLDESQVEAEKIKESGLIRKKITVKVTQKVSGATLVNDFINGIIERMEIRGYGRRKGRRFLCFSYRRRYRRSYRIQRRRIGFASISFPFDSQQR